MGLSIGRIPRLDKSHSGPLSSGQLSATDLFTIACGQDTIGKFLGVAMRSSAMVAQHGQP